MVGARLVGRDQECEAIDGLLTAPADQAAVRLVRGEPGIGKSALLDHAARRAAGRGVRVLSTTGVESEARLPYAGLHQLLRPLLGDVDALAEPQRSALRVAFALEPGDAPSLFAVALAVLQLLSDAAGDEPLLVLVEDAHWLDRSSAEVLAFVARRTDSEPIVVLIAARDDDGLALSRAGLPELTLGPLGPDDAATLLDAQPTRLPPAVRRQVLGEAAGNPLALVELPIAWSGLQDGADLVTAMPLTARLEQAFAKRAAALPPATRRAVLVAALDDAGAVIEVLDAVAQLTGAPADAELLAPAEAAGLLVLQDGAIRFRHPLIRSAVRRTAAATDRRAAHAALARVLSDQEERQVWHRAAASLGRDERMAAALEDVAARARARGALAVAVDALQRAARLTPTARGQARRLLDAGELAHDLGRPELLERLLGEAAALELASAERARLMWLREELDVGSWSGSDRVRAFAEHAREMTAAGDPELAVRSMLPIALRLWWSNPDKVMSDLVVEVAEQIELPDEHPALLAILAYAHPLQRGAVVLERIRRLAPEELDDPLSMYLVGSAATAVFAHDLALPFFEAATEPLRAQGRLGLLAQTLASDAWAAVHLARRVRAESSADEAVRLARETGQPRWALAAELAQATLAGERGHVARMDAINDRTEAAFIAAGAHPMLSLVQFARGRCAVAHQRYDEGAAHLGRVLEPTDIAYHPLVGAWGLSDLVEAALHLGDRPGAEVHLGRLERLAEAVPGQLLLTQRDYARALLADDAQAPALFDRALSGALLEWPCFRGRLLLHQGRWLRRSRRVADSRTPLRAARETFDALGFDALSDYARHELRASGETSRRRTSDARDELSPQELQIARLAALGLSNKEIGQRLYLSHRTVGSHLYRAYPKLGVTSRTELRDALGAVAG